MNDTLQHHGIEGQKWGVRRYQNADGSLTAAGKKHISGSDSVSKDYKEAREKRSVKKMSNSELKNSINRLQMEQQYKELKKKQGVINKGANFVKTAVAATTTAITVYNNSQKLIEIGKKFAKK